MKSNPFDTGLFSGGTLAPGRSQKLGNLTSQYPGSMDAKENTNADALPYDFVRTFANDSRCGSKPKFCMLGNRKAHFICSLRHK